MSELNTALLGWTQFANELGSSIDLQLFEPAFCTDTQVRFETICTARPSALFLPFQIADFVKDALQQTAK
jgi:hypothetical protein